MKATEETRMELRMVTRTSAELIRKFKNEKVDEADETVEWRDLDTVPMIEVYRGTMPVVVAMMLEHDSEKVVLMARALIFGFDADKCVLSTEAFQAEGLTNPVTGKRWKPHEMQDVAINHDGIAKGWVAENLSTTGVNAAGDVVMIGQSFKVDRTPKGWSITWLDEKVIDSTEVADAKSYVGGYIVDSLHSAMNEPSLTQVMAQKTSILPSDYGLEDAEEIRAHLDCAAVKMLYAAKIASAALMLHAETGSVREAVIERSMGQLAEASNAVIERLLDDDED